MATQTHTQKLDIQQQAVCFSIKLGAPRTKRRVDSDEVQSDADESMLHISKDIYKSEKLQEITRRQTALYTYMRSHCLPSPFKTGVYLVSVKMLDDIVKHCAKEEADIAELADEFITWYQDIYDSRNDANSDLRKRLGSLYDPSDYPKPERLRKSFQFETSIWELSTPGKLKVLDRKLYEKEEEKMRQVWKNAEAQITQLMLVELRKLTAHVVDRMTPNPDGTKKKFFDSVITNMTDWLSIFDKRRLTDDADLMKVVKQARALVTGLDPEGLRDSEVLKQQVSNEMQKLTKQLDVAIQTKPGRRIDLD